MCVQLLSLSETTNFLSKKELQLLESRIENKTLEAIVDHDVPDPYVIVRGKAVSLFVIMSLIGKE